jgi:hypothetical protein
VVRRTRLEGDALRTTVAFFMNALFTGNSHVERYCQIPSK